MKSMKAILRTLYLGMMTWGCWAVIEGLAWARPATNKAKEEGSGPGDWVLPYFIVVLCISLGMLIVCRTARRSDRAKPQKYEALKTAD